MLNDDYDNARKILEKYNQQQLLAFYNELETKEKEALIQQICSTNFRQIFDLYEASKHDEVIAESEISPLNYNIKAELSNDEINFYENIGIDTLKMQKCAVVTLAGGQGTRLGYKGPKGTFELDIVPKKSLFEISCDNLKNIYNKYSVYLPWYIMTSTYNDKETRKFFEEKNFFDYPREYVLFFTQKQLPLIDITGNLILEEPYKIKEASNGNGDVFESMLFHNVIDDLEKRKIEWVFFSGIDNVILDIVDPLLLGLTIFNKKEIASKTLFKKNVDDNDWIFARRDGKPSIINSNHLTLEMKIAKNDNGNFLYRETNMLAHLFSLSAIKKVCHYKLPYHRAFKKNTFVNEEGMKQVPEKPNTFKFETFIFDAFSLFDDIELLRVEEKDEFAPIKDFNGVHNPERAKELYEKKFHITPKETD